MSLTRGLSAATVFAEYACTAPLAASTRSAWTSLHQVSLHSPRHSIGLFGGCKHFQNGHPAKAVRQGRESGHQASRSWFRKNTLQPHPASSGQGLSHRSEHRRPSFPSFSWSWGKRVDSLLPALFCAGKHSALQRGLGGLPRLCKNNDDY